MAGRKKKVEDESVATPVDEELDLDEDIDGELDLDDELDVDDEIDEELDLDDDLDTDEQTDDEIVLDGIEGVGIDELPLEEDGDEDDVEEADEADEADEEDSDDTDDDEVESALDDILRERFVVTEVDDEEEVDESGDTVVRVKPRQPDEFVCQSCFLVKSMIQLADADKMFCRDCV